MGAEAAAPAVGPVGGWNTWEELILGAAVLRHGRHDWNVVASELRARTRLPTFFTPEVCKSKYEELRKRYAGSRNWFEELRKQCVAELKHKLARSEASIGFLEAKIKYLEAGKQSPNHAWGQTGSPTPTLNSDGTESSSIRILSTDEQSVASYTRTRTSSLSEHLQETKPHVSVSSDHDKDSSVGFREGMITRKKRGLRKRKGCDQAVKEGSVGDSDNLGSSNVVVSPTPDRDQIRDPPTKDNNLMEIFESIAVSEPALVFRHRMDGQKRGRYKKIVRQHVDIGMIRSMINAESITSVKELFRYLLLLPTNALVFYSSRTREYKSALSLRHLVMKEYKQHCRGSCMEPTSTFLPFNPPVKPRSARPPPKFFAVDNSTPADGLKAMEKASDSDCDVSLNSLFKVKKGVKRLGEVKPESGNTQPKLVM
ncbi:hypothetical protein ACS0TY_032080 [Phlomoides rotata]